MKSLLTASVTVQEATEMVQSLLKERSGADNVTVTIEEAPPKPAFFAGDFSLDAPLPLSVMRVIIDQPHNKIQQIKELRAVTGWGLKEAKDYIENLWYKYLGRPNPFGVQQ